ncbi:MAG TPA: site-2 protease family protein [Candidatus Dormibacteraeota bacterium]
MSAGQILIDIGAIALTFLVIVLVHEAGHFVVAKLSGIRVDEFAIGFGPKLVARRIGETLYSIRALPAGGYVRMPGMLGIEGEADAGERNFYRASKTKRFMTVAAGIVFNLVFAGICFTVVNLAPTPSRVVDGGALAASGIPSGATIRSINGTAIRHDTPKNVTNDLHAATQADQGRAMQVAYTTSDGAQRSAVVRPQLVVILPTEVSSLQPGVYVVTSVNGHAPGTGDPAQVLGSGGSVTINGYTQGTPSQKFNDITLSHVTTGYGSPESIQATWLIGLEAGFDGQPLATAVVNGFRSVPDFIREQVVGVYQLITVPSLGGIAGPNGLSGPVGIAQQTVSQAQGGLFGQQGLIWWIGFVSMSLGLINVLPIPFLDGGKLFFILVEAVRRKRVDPRVEAAASAIGLALVVLLLVYVTIGNVSRL